MPATPTPLIPDPLQADLEQLHDAMMLIKDPAQAKAYHCSQLATIITNHIKRLFVDVTTAGSATAQRGIGTVL
jgi:hypothetical protein